MYSVVVVYLFYKRHFDEVSESHLIMSDSLRPHGLYSPWNSPGQNIGVGRALPPPGDLPDPGMELRSPALQAGS